MRKTKMGPWRADIKMCASVYTLIYACVCLCRRKSARASVCLNVQVQAGVCSTVFQLGRLKRTAGGFPLRDRARDNNHRREITMLIFVAPKGVV